MKKEDSILKKEVQQALHAIIHDEIFRKAWIENRWKNGSFSLLEFYKSYKDSKNDLRAWQLTHNPCKLLRS